MVGRDTHRHMIANEAAGMLADGVGIIIRLAFWRLIFSVVEWADELISARELARVKKTSSAQDRSIISIEAALHRPIGHDRGRWFFQCTATCHLPVA